MSESKIEETNFESEADAALDATVGNAPGNKLKRNLQSRHIQMIAIGGTIGTGLFVASGSTIASAGPLGALIAFTVIGLQVWGVVTSIGEMAAFIPTAGSFNHYAGRFVDPALGFAVGWNYWAQWAVTLPAELAALGIIMYYWAPGVPTWIWAVISVLFLFGMNALGVKGFGELEYWLSFIKVVAILVFIVIAILIAAGAIGGKVIGFSNYYIEGAPFNPAGFVALFTAFPTAFYSYGGTELVGITAGEAANPRKSVPRAITSTFFRILLFYVISIFLVGLIIPNTEPRLALGSISDPTTATFTLAYELAGLGFGANLMNAVILIALVSAGNSSLYACSRTLMALAEEGKAPQFVAKVDKRGVPMFSLILTTIIGCIAFLGSVFGDGVVFSFLLNILGIASLLAWMTVSVTHLRFRAGMKAQGIPLKVLPYVAPFYPFADILSLFIGFFVLAGLFYIAFTTPFDASLNAPYYIGIPLFFICYAGYKIVKKTKIVGLMEMDFDTGRLAEEEVSGTKESFLKRTIDFLA